MVGTDFGEWALYQDIILKRGGQYQEFETAVYKAIDPLNSGPNHELWPEHWPIDRLMSEKNTRGVLGFERYMQNNPKAYEAGIFKEKWLKWYDTILPNLRIYFGVDLAISKHEKANYFVILVLGLNEVNDMYILEILREHYGFKEQVDAIISLSKKWNPLGIGIGNKSYQEVMPQHLNDITALPINRIDEHTPKEARLTKMSLYFENGKIYLHNTMLGLKEEMMTYDPDDTSKSPDQLDALYFAIETALGNITRKVVTTIAGESWKKNKWGL
jgi:phage terminase large subunit-like protein